MTEAPAGDFLHAFRHCIKSFEKNCQVSAKENNFEA